ncbi:hypothetical protein CHUAL_011713 [Chamberlinius hualienensis]
MAGRRFFPAETVVEQLDTTNAAEEDRYFGTRSGMSLVFQSAILRMTLVATSTVVAVTSIAFLTIGTCELSDKDASNGNEALVLLAGGVILLIASLLQFISVGVLSGWCTIWPANESCSREIRLLPPNQYLINGQMVNFKSVPPDVNRGHLIPCAGFELLEPSLQAIPEEESDNITRTFVSRSSERPRHDVISGLEVGGNNATFGDGSKVDATTCTRGEMVYFPIRGYAPLALQEEMTPSLRSSFQSFDELA